VTIRALLVEKQLELGGNASKLSSGVAKLHETRDQVAEMQVSNCIMENDGIVEL
jgi:hypothetical protein